MFLTEFDAIFSEEPEDDTTTPPEVSVTEPLTPEDIRSPRRQMFSDIPTPSYDTFPTIQQFAPSQPKQPHPLYEQSFSSHPEHDTGLIPLQPSYETSTSFSPNLSATTRSGAGSVTMPGPDGVIARKPGTDSAAKARRRESSMLLMSNNLGIGGQRKSSMPMLRNNAGMTFIFSPV